MKAWTPRILRRYGFRTVLVVNGVLTGLVTLALFAFNRSTPAAAILLVVLTFGFGRSLQLSALNAFTFANVPAGKMSAATSLSGMLQQLAGAVGIAVSALLLRSIVTLRGGSVGSLNAADIRDALVVVAAFSVAAGLAFLALDRESGIELSGQRSAAS
jgi:hypothetical protein